MKLTGKPVTADYVPQAYYGQLYPLISMPIFSLHVVTTMLCDPRVVFGLLMIKGPLISKSKFFVDCDNSEAKEYIKDNLTRFWRGGAMRALKAIEWGYSCSEVLYAKENGKVMFVGLKDLHPLDCKLITLEGEPFAAKIRNVPSSNRSDAFKRQVTLQGPKFFWHVHNRDRHPYYGQSRLHGCYQPWIEKWMPGAFRDSRKLFFYKYAFAGPTVRHPPGMVNTEVAGVQRPAKDLAREIGEKSRNGAVVTMPNDVDPNGNPLWSLEPASVMAAPPGLMEYGHDLDDEIWEGMGVPPEVGRAEGTGAYAGRRVPLDAFFSILQEIVYWMSFDFKNQIMQNLMDVYYPDVAFDIVPFPLLKPEQEEESPEEQMEDDDESSVASFQEDDNSAILISNSPPAGYAPRYSIAQ